MNQMNKSATTAPNQRKASLHAETSVVRIDGVGVMLGLTDEAGDEFRRAAEGGFFFLRNFDGGGNAFLRFRGGLIDQPRGGGQIAPAGAPAGGMHKSRPAITVAQAITASGIASHDGTCTHAEPRIRTTTSQTQAHSAANLKIARARASMRARPATMRRGSTSRCGMGRGASGMDCMAVIGITFARCRRWSGVGHSSGYIGERER